jgi:hypothetical protein
MQRLQDFIAEAAIERAEQHRRRHLPDELWRRMPPGVWEMAQDHVGTEEGPRANRPHAQETWERIRATEDEHGRALRQRLRDVNAQARRMNIWPGSEQEEDIQHQYETAIIGALGARRPEWSWSRRRDIARPIARRWKVNTPHVEKEQLIDEVMRMVGY